MWGRMKPCPKTVGIVLILLGALLLVIFLPVKIWLSILGLALVAAGVWLRKSGGC